MRNPCFGSLLAALLLSGTSFLTSTQAHALEAEFGCRKTAAFFAPAKPPSGRHYAPDKEVQVEHLVLDITPDFQQRTITGTATYRFKPLHQPALQLRLDAVDLRIQEVSSSEPIQAHEVTRDELIVTFTRAIPMDNAATLTVRYSAEPDRGLYFRTPEMGYKEGDTHLFTQCEAVLARHWFPSFDSPNRLLTSETICRAPEGMTVISMAAGFARTRVRDRPGAVPLCPGKTARELPAHAGRRLLQKARR
jgi:aminopeptidase N